MSKKVKIILIIIGIIILGIVIFKVYEDRNNEENDNELNNEPVANTVEEVEVDVEEVKKIKEEISATAEENIYEIQREYDGRKILAIKPTVQFKTVLAGILKNAEPTKQEAENVNLSNFSNNGIWISEVSRNTFLNILKECGVDNFKINDEGYLYMTSESYNKYGIKLKELINSKELIIIDISGKCYIRDEMTGQIVEYPFKDMDLYQICEVYKINGSKIIVITTNEVKSEDILEEICN